MLLGREGQHREDVRPVLVAGRGWHACGGSQSHMYGGEEGKHKGGCWAEPVQQLSTQRRPAMLVPFADQVP